MLVAVVVGSTIVASTASVLRLLQRKKQPPNDPPIHMHVMHQETRKLPVHIWLHIVERTDDLQAFWSLTASNRDLHALRREPALMHWREQQAYKEISAFIEAERHQIEEDKKAIVREWLVSLQCGTCILCLGLGLRLCCILLYHHLPIQLLHRTGTFIPVAVAVYMAVTLVRFHRLSSPIQGLKWMSILASLSPSLLGLVAWSLDFLFISSYQCEAILPTQRRIRLLNHELDMRTRANEGFINSLLDCYLLEGHEARGVESARQYIQLLLESMKWMEQWRCSGPSCLDFLAFDLCELLQWRILPLLLLITLTSLVSNFIRH